MSALCSIAGVACRASGPWLQRMIAIERGSGYAISAEPGGFGGVHLHVPAGLTPTQAAQYGLAMLAYGLMDPVARESIRGQAWAKPSVPRGRPRTGTALSARERQRAFRDRKLFALIGK